MSQHYDAFPINPLLADLREDWARHFGREAPLELEIGFGYGHFLIEYAAAHPERDLVGIEVKARFARKANAAASRRGLENVLALAGDARKLLPTLFAPGSLDAVHVQFPDPWWKKRHHKRRLVDPALARQLAVRVRPGGRVYLRTDILAYARAMVEAFETPGSPWANREGSGRFCRDDGLGVPSNRERRYLASGTPVYRLVYTLDR